MLANCPCLKMMSRNTPSEPQPDSASNAIRKLQIFFSRLFFFVLPLLPGVWKIAKPHKPKNENHCMGMIDSSNEAFWCTDYNGKPQLSARSYFLKNQEKPQKENGNFWRLVILGYYVRFFSKMVLCRELGFFFAL